MNRIVPIFPWPVHSKVAEQLESVPDITLVEAIPGGPGPVLAVMKMPPFVCDAILVKSPEKLAQAVDIVVGDKIEMVSMRQVLEATLSPNGVPMVEYVSENVSNVKFI